MNQQQYEYFVSEGVEEQLKKLFYSAMDYLEIPESASSNGNGTHPNKKDLVGKISVFERFGFEGKVDIWHFMRMGIYSTLFLDYFRIKDQSFRHDFFAAATIHDVGKEKMYHLTSAENFGKEHREQIKHHVDWEVLGDLFNERTKSMAHRHHHHRDEDHYPKEAKGSSEPEVILGGRALNKLDWFDSATTRYNGRIRLSEDDLRRGRNFPSKETVKEPLISAFRRQKVFYEGSLCPPIFLSAKDFIEEMYSRGIFSFPNDNDVQAQNPFNGLEFGANYPWSSLSL